MNTQEVIALARHHLVEHTPECPDVRALIHWLTPSLRSGRA